MTVFEIITVIAMSILGTIFVSIILATIGMFIYSKVLDRRERNESRKKQSQTIR